MKRNAFTLIEVLIAIVLIGLTIVGLLGANKAFTQSNSTGVELSTSAFLIQQIREMMILLPVVDPQTRTAQFGPEEASLSAYDDVDDFDGASYCPPINLDRQTLNSFASYQQQIIVDSVDSTNFSQPVADHTSPFVRVTVKIYHNSKLVTTENWIRARF